MAEQRLEASDRVHSLRSNHSRSDIERSSRYALRKDGDKGKENSGRSARVATQKREARGKLVDNLRLSVRVVGGTRRFEGSDALRTGCVRTACRFLAPADFEFWYEFPY